MFTTAHEITKILLDEQVENRAKPKNLQNLLFNMTILMSYLTPRWDNFSKYLAVLYMLYSTIFCYFCDTDD